MNLRNEHKNEFVLKGELKSKYKGNADCVVVCIKVGDRTYPEVVCWNENARRVLQYNVGDTITLLCNAQSSLHRNSVDKPKVTVSLFCTCILDNALITAPTYNRFSVSGQVVSCSVCENRMSLLIRVVGEHISTFNVVIYNPNPRVHCFEENQPINVQGYVKTVIRTDENNKKLYFTDYITERISNF